MAFNRKQQTLKELLMQTTHHNAYVHKDALLGIKDLILRHPREIELHKLAIIEKLSPRISDSDKGVRETLFLVLKSSIFPRLQEIMKPVMENLPCRATGVGKGARLFGMYGVFGSGKTTLCKILYTHYLETFNDRSCHIQLGVGFSIVELQKKVLTELTQASNEWMEELTDSDIGQKYVKEHMTEHKVVLALDNVSDTQSLQVVH